VQHPGPGALLFSRGAREGAGTAQGVPKSPGGTSQRLLVPAGAAGAQQGAGRVGMGRLGRVGTPAVGDGMLRAGSSTAC